MKLFLLLISVAVASCLSDHELWTDFKITHAKTYLNKNEEVKRFEIFQQNLREIEEHNAKYNKGEFTYYKGVNQFTDLTHSEYVQMLNYNRDSRPIHQNATALKFSREDLRDLPASVDWRQHNAVSEVKNQGGCGSCWAFSTTGGLEGQFAIKYGHIVSLSEQNLLDCSTSYGNGNCSQGGLMIFGFNYVKDYGINSEAEYPYETRQANCRYNPSTSVLHISGYTVVDQNEDALKYAVATYGPITVAIDFSLAGGYAGGIFNNPACANDGDHLNHGVLVVGYGSENGIDYWIVKNSWSANFGEQGYIRMIRNANNQCGIVDDATFPQVL